MHGEWVETVVLVWRCVERVVVEGIGVEDVAVEGSD